MRRLFKILGSLIPVAFATLMVTSANAQELQRLLPGVTFAANAWEVTTSVDGHISALHFSEGEFVSEGDLLVEMDASAAALEVQLAEVKLARAEAILTEGRSDLERQQELERREAVSIAALGDAEFNVEVFELDLKVAEAELAIAREELQRHSIYAPADGLISAPKVVVGGNYSAALSGAIANIVQLDPIHVRIPIRPEEVVRRIQEGGYTLEEARKLEFEMIGPNGGAYSELGYAVSVGFDMNLETGEGSVIVEFPNPEGYLRPGLRVHLRVKE
ncbi:efflux RND transporter periplasmic adaptor subunit [Oceanomicrobium pacificus]|uniref:Efflux RND transporter periplasmic adaptor subunit n=1 Tax=Oceanomicrobium pacificus TaxID=2692916 RepID=A0A6B0TVL2_9RHOB|nr:efflux RND transporter periplasmic adaptor subunit [Oceanomicrobium pacificus]MXU65023.1 efflux RND transporter periplasmic adaptor subunit [Oceanomicrobium pacificus]